MKHKVIYILFILFVFGCSLIQRESEGRQLTIKVYNGSRSILSPSVDITKLLVSGFNSSSSDTISLSEFGSTDTIKFQNLSLGTWNISVTAYNSKGEYIGIGQGAVTLNNNDDATLNITINPINGRGSLDLTLNIPAVVSNPIIEATLQLAGGVQKPIIFTQIPGSSNFNYSKTYIDGDNTTGLETGYYILNVQLKDGNFNNDLRGGFTEVVRIMDKISTSASINIVLEDLQGFTFESSNLADNTVRPFGITISGDAKVSYGNTASFTASPESGITVIDYYWYINGESYGASSPSITTGSELTPGDYLITCIAVGDKKVSSDQFVLTVVDEVYPYLFQPTDTYLIEFHKNGENKDVVSFRWPIVLDNFTSRENLEYRVTYSSDATLSDETDILPWTKDTYFINEYDQIINPADKYYRVYARDGSGNILTYVNDSIVYVSAPNADGDNDNSNDIGKDTNDGLTASTPVATLNRALEALKKLNSNKIYFTTGQYDLNETIVIDSSLLFKGGFSLDFSTHNAYVVGDSSYMTAISVNENNSYNGISSAFYFDRGAEGAQLQFLHITANSNTSLSNSKNTAVYINNTTPTISSCTIAGNNNTSINLNDHEVISVTGEFANANIESSLIKGVSCSTRLVSVTDNANIRVDSSQLILDSVVTGLTARYIYIDNSSANIYGNIFDENQDHTSPVVHIELGRSVKNVSIFNNIFYFWNRNVVSILETAIDSDPTDVSSNSFNIITSYIGTDDRPVLYRDYLDDGSSVDVNEDNFGTQEIYNVDVNPIILDDINSYNSTSRVMNPIE